ncbi:MAG: hypothetical protein WAO00_17580, partial [Chthoniobacterales bacterium]
LQTIMKVRIKILQTDRRFDFKHIFHQLIPIFKTHRSARFFDSQPSTLNSQLPKGIPIPGKAGFVQSPYDPKFIIDVRGFPPGTLVNDPNTNKPFRVP